VGWLGGVGVGGVKKRKEQIREKNRLDISGAGYGDPSPPNSKRLMVTGPAGEGRRFKVISTGEKKFIEGSMSRIRSKRVR